ncbi:hypothetical protein PS15m_008678 [Mucor circinelloides]
MLPPRVWREFWSLSLPAKAFTPWWRLLHDRLSVRSRLHALNPSSFPSPLCALGDEATEDVYHMILGCYMKPNFCFEVVAHLGLVDDFLADEAIWIALTKLKDKNGSPLDSSILELLGTAFYTLWKLHWRCVLDNVLWQSQILFESFLAENASLISSFLDM